MRYAALLLNEYADKYPKANIVLEEGLVDSLQFYSFPGIDHRKINSTNVLERLNKEIRRRTKVIGHIPLPRILVFVDDKSISLQAIYFTSY